MNHSIHKGSGNLNASNDCFGVFFSKMFTECMEKPCLLKPNQSVFKGIFHYNPLSQIKRESRKIKLKKNDFRICLSIAYFFLTQMDSLIDIHSDMHYLCQ